MVGIGREIKKELKFQLWSRLNEKYYKILRRTVVCGLWLWFVVVVCGFVVFSDYNTYPSLNLDFNLD